MKPGPLSEVGEMLHYCGLRNKWVSERVFVASPMQHTIEPGPLSRGGEILHHRGLRNKWVSERAFVASPIGCNTLYRGGRDVASLWPTERMG